MNVATFLLSVSASMGFSGLLAFVTYRILRATVLDLFIILAREEKAHQAKVVEMLDDLAGTHVL